MGTRSALRVGLATSRDRTAYCRLSANATRSFRQLSGANRRGVALSLGAITAIQVGNAIAVSLIDHLGSATTVLLRNGFAAVFLITAARPVLRAIGGTAWGWVILFGLCLSAHSTFVYLAIGRIPLGVTLAIAFLGPLTVSAWFAGRRVERLWVGLAGGGVLLILWPVEPAGLDAVGVAAAFGAAAGWAGYILFSRRLAILLPGVQGLALSMTASLPGLFVVAAASASLQSPSKSQLLVAAAVGLLTVAVPFSMETMALRILPLQTFGVLASLEPVVAAAAGILIARQSLALHSAAGIVLVVCAAAGAARSSRGYTPARASTA